MTEHRKLTDAEVDVLLERYDQTEPRLQRRIVATFVARCVEAQDALVEHCKEVLQVLDLQQRYFKSGKNPALLEESRGREAALRKRCKDIISPRQPTLFGPSQGELAS